MKTKKIIMLMLSTVMLGSMMTKHIGERKVDAAANTVWRITGAFTEQGGSDYWNAECEDPAHIFTFNTTTSKHELTILLTAGLDFKFTQGGSWDNSIGPAGSWNWSPENEFFREYGGNIRCFKTGNYLLELTENASTMSHFTFSPVTSGETVTVSYYNDTELLATVDIDKNLPYDPIHIDVDGYKLEGWYTDPTFSTKFVKGTPIAVNTDLYGKYEVAEVQGVYVKKNTAWTAVNLYMWNEDYVSYNNTWPGKQMNLVSGTSNIYYYELPLGSCFNKVIINNNAGGQTEDLDLTFGDNLIYDLAADLSVTTYETFTNIVVLAGDTIATLETQCFGYQGGVASETGVYYIHLDNGTVVAELTDDRAVMVGTISAYILANTENACGIDGEYLLILEGLLAELTTEELLTIADTVDRVAYLRTIVDARNDEGDNPLRGINSILDSNNKTALYAIMIIGIMGLISISGYYFFVKKRYSN